MRPSNLEDGGGEQWAALALFLETTCTKRREVDEESRLIHLSLGSNTELVRKSPDHPTIRIRVTAGGELTGGKKRGIVGDALHR